MSPSFRRPCSISVIAWCMTTPNRASARGSPGRDPLAVHTTRELEGRANQVAEINAPQPGCKTCPRTLQRVSFLDGSEEEVHMVRLNSKGKSPRMELLGSGQLREKLPVNGIKGRLQINDQDSGGAALLQHVALKGPECNRQDRRREPSTDARMERGPNAIWVLRKALGEQ